MAIVNIDYNELKGYLIPSGNYNASIIKVEAKETKDQTGYYLSLSFKLLSSEYAGSVVYSMITLKNKNEMAEKIGQQQLKKLMEACGTKFIKDTDELIGKNISVKVGIKPGNDVYGESNIVKGFAPISIETVKNSNPFR